jgi:hypothetical protein
LNLWLTPRSLSPTVTLLASQINRPTYGRFTDYMGEMMDLCFSRRAEELNHKYLDAANGSAARTILTCVLPLSEIVTDFFDKLKSRSSGFASFECVLTPLAASPLTFRSPESYEDAGYRPSNLSKVSGFDSPCHFIHVSFTDDLLT